MSFCLFQFGDQLPEDNPVSQEGVPAGYKAVSLIEALNGPCGLPPPNTMEGGYHNNLQISLLIKLSIQPYKVICSYKCKLNTYIGCQSIYQFNLLGPIAQSVASPTRMYGPEIDHSPDMYIFSGD